MKASQSNLDDIYWENSNGPSSSRAWKKSRIVLKRQSITFIYWGNSGKALEQIFLLPRVRSSAPRRLRSRIFIRLFFPFWALYCAFPVAPLIPREIWKIKKKQRHDHSPALYWPREFWLTDLVQMVISSDPAPGLPGPDLPVLQPDTLCRPKSLHLMTLLLLGWVALGHTDPYICRDPDNMWKNMGGNIFIQVEKVFLTGSIKLTNMTLLPKVFLSI